MLNTAYYQRMANENYNEVSPHTGQNGHHKKKKKERNLQTINSGEDVGEKEPFCTVGGNVN